MAAIDFPATPTIGQQFVAGNGVTYQWDGTKWFAVGGGSTPTATNVPTVAQVGDVAINVVNQFFNGPNTGPIGAAGQVWLLLATVGLQHSDGSTNNYFEVDIWDGAAVAGGANNKGVFSSVGATVNVGGALHAIATLTGPTTFTVRAKQLTGTTPTTGLLLGSNTAITAVRLA